jgi:hypothetical protein
VGEIKRLAIQIDAARQATVGEIGWVLAQTDAARRAAVEHIECLANETGGGLRSAVGRINRFKIQMDAAILTALERIECLANETGGGLRSAVGDIERVTTETNDALHAVLNKISRLMIQFEDLRHAAVTEVTPSPAQTDTVCDDTVVEVVSGLMTQIEVVCHPAMEKAARLMAHGDDVRQAAVTLTARAVKLIDDVRLVAIRVIAQLVTETEAAHQTVVEQAALATAEATRVAEELAALESARLVAEGMAKDAPDIALLALAAEKQAYEEAAKDVADIVDKLSIPINEDVPANVVTARHLKDIKAFASMQCVQLKAYLMGSPSKLQTECFLKELHDCRKAEFQKSVMKSVQRDWCHWFLQYFGTQGSHISFVPKSASTPVVLNFGQLGGTRLSKSHELFHMGSDPRCHLGGSLFMDPLHCTLQLDDGFLFVTCCVTKHPPIVIQRADPAIPEFSLPSGMQTRVYVGDTLHLTETWGEDWKRVEISVTIEADVTELHAEENDDRLLSSSDDESCCSRGSRKRCSSNEDVSYYDEQRGSPKRVAH